jgi:glyoxylate carboligase
MPVQENEHGRAANRSSESFSEGAAPSAAPSAALDPGQKISGGNLIAKALTHEGVEAIFTLCGGHIIDIYDGCQNEGIKIVDVRREQVAAHAADGYWRVTGKTGCAVVTAGPGTTDARTGVANAFRAENAMLLIGTGPARAASERIADMVSIRRARESAECALINVWIDLEAYAPGTMNQTIK